MTAPTHSRWLAALDGLVAAAEEVLDAFPHGGEAHGFPRWAPEWGDACVDLRAWRDREVKVEAVAYTREALAADGLIAARIADLKEHVAAVLEDGSFELDDEVLLDALAVYVTNVLLWADLDLADAVLAWAEAHNEGVVARLATLAKEGDATAGFAVRAIVATEPRLAWLAEHHEWR